MKKLVIFDLDGTLLDSVNDLAASVNHALGTFGYPARTVAEVKSFIGNGVTKLIERALPENHKTGEEISKTKMEFIAYYNIHGVDMTTPFEGIPELLESLQDKGIKLAVASNKYNEGAVNLVKHYFPDIRFGAILGQNETRPVKPDPAIIFEICSKCGASVGESIYVGDSYVDMETARNAGIECIGVTWGCQTAEVLSRYSPLCVTGNAGDIFEIACGQPCPGTL